MEGIHTDINKFPPELIDSIIGELDHGDANNTQVQEEGPNRNLLQCMKVARSFYLAARRRIFAHVSLDVFNGHKTTDHLANSLHEIIAANPAVLNEVKSLTVNIVTVNPEDGDDPANTPIEKEHPTFTGLLLLLARAQIRSFTLQTKIPPWQKERRMCADLSALNDSVLLAFIAVRRTPSLRALHLRDLDNLPEKLVTGQPDQDMIETLDMHEASFPSKGAFRSLCLPLHPPNKSSFASMDSILDPAPTVTSTPLSKLVNLELSNPCPFYKYMQRISKHQPSSSFTLTNLKSFRYSPIRLCFDADGGRSDEDIKDAQFHRLILHNSPVLESLTLQQKTITYNVPLNLIPTLRNLHFELHIFQYLGPRKTKCLEYLSQALDKATTANSIETISINVTFSIEISILADLVDPRSHWRLVDAALGRPAYASLKKVEVMLNFRLLHTYGFDLDNQKTKEIIANTTRDSKLVLPALMNRDGVELIQSWTTQVPDSGRWVVWPFPRGALDGCN